MPLGQVIAFDAARGAPESLQPLLDIVSADMDAINRIILDKAVSDVELIPELAHHLIDSGGKRLRPMLAIAASKLCGYRGNGHIRVASAIEFMHTATLLHDDVVDESGLRRGKQTARMLWGNQASVLVGDFLLGQAFRMLVDVGSLPVLKILSNAAAVIAEGEVMQLAAAKNTATTEDEYLAIINAKTAALFSAAAEVGAAIANRPAAEQTALKSYGRNLGLAFQLVDDALDYSGDSARLGKAVGDDFREGKITLPVILSFRRGSEDGARVLEAHHRRGRDRGRRPRARCGADETAQGHRGDDGAGALLRRHRPRRARHIPRSAGKSGHAGRDRVLRASLALKKLLTPQAILPGGGRQPRVRASRGQYRGTSGAFAASHLWTDSRQGRHGSSPPPALLAGAAAAAQSAPPSRSGIQLVKLGITDMSKAEQANLWKLVDEYATVDALQEFCGTKLNLQRRAWRAVATCVEPTSLRKVFGTFKTKKDGYLKQWETLHGQPEAKKAVCDRFKSKLAEYSKIMSGQINEAATACRNCFFC